MENTIYTAMAQIMADCEAISKSKTNQQQGFKFRGIDDVYNTLHSLMAKHGVVCLPEVESIDSTERTNKNGTVIFSRIAKVKYTFAHMSGTTVSTSVYGEAMDSGDKATSKALAIAHKYALLQTFLIPTEDMDDPDSQTHEVKPDQKQVTQYTASQMARLQETAIGWVKMARDKSMSSDGIEAFFATIPTASAKDLNEGISKIQSKMAGVK